MSVQNFASLDFRVFVVPPPIENQQRLTTDAKQFASRDAYAQYLYSQDRGDLYANSNSVNTLAHYIAMKDNLYCCNIFQQFGINPLTRDTRLDSTKIKDL